MRKINLILVSDHQQIGRIADLLKEPIYWLDAVVEIPLRGLGAMDAQLARGQLHERVQRLPDFDVFFAAGREYLTPKVWETQDDYVNIYATAPQGKSMFIANSVWEYEDGELIAKRLPNYLRTVETPTKWSPELWVEINTSTRVKDWRESIRAWFVDDFLGLPLTEAPELPETQYGENPVKPIRLYWMNQNNPIRNDLATVAQYPFRSLLFTPEFQEFWPGVDDTKAPPDPIETFKYIRELSRKLRNDGKCEYNWYLDILDYRGDFYLLLDGKWVGCNTLKHALANEFDVVVDTTTRGKLEVVKHRLVGRHTLLLDPQGESLKCTTIRPNHKHPGLVNLHLDQLSAFYWTDQELGKIVTTREIPEYPLFTEYLNDDVNWLESYGAWLGLNVAITFPAVHTTHPQAVLRIETNCNYPRANKVDTYQIDLAPDFWTSGKNYTVDLSSLELPGY